jgi:hypothetical protein
MGFGGMELDAGNDFLFAVLLFVESAGYHVDRADLLAAGFLFVSKHFEVVLENVNNFVRLKGLLNTEGNTVNKFVHLVVDGSTASTLFLDLVNKVTGLVLHASIDGSVEVSLGVKVVHFVGGLETHLEHLLIGAPLNRALVFLNKFKVSSSLCSLLVNKLDVFEAKLTARLGDTNFNELSKRQGVRR